MALYGFPAAGGDGELAGRGPAKTKRKDLEEVYDELSEFSLFSPARKSRRLDTEFTPIMEEEEELALPHVFGQPLPDQQLQSCSQEMAVVLAEADPRFTVNEERAIVLYKPVHAPILDLSSSSEVFLNVHPDVIAGFKNRGFWSGQSSKVEIRELEEEAPADDRQAASSSCLAMVPWTPSQPTGASFPAGVNAGMTELAEEAMVAEDMGASSMDVEEEEGRPDVATAPGDGMVATQGFQHCMLPQISASNSTQITWSWG